MIEASWRTRVLFSVKLVRNEQKKLSGGGSKFSDFRKSSGPLIATPRHADPSCFLPSRKNGRFSLREIIAVFSTQKINIHFLKNWY